MCVCVFLFALVVLNVCVRVVGYTTDDLQFMWQTGDPVQMDAIALPQFDIRQEDIDYGNCTKFYAGTGTAIGTSFSPERRNLSCFHCREVLS